MDVPTEEQVTDDSGASSRQAFPQQENMEDILTSNVFELLRYLEPKAGLLPFLRMARYSDGSRVGWAAAHHSPMAKSGVQALGGASRHFLPRVQQPRSLSLANTSAERIAFIA